MMGLLNSVKKRMSSREGHQGGAETVGPHTATPSATSSSSGAGGGAASLTNGTSASSFGGGGGAARNHFAASTNIPAVSSHKMEVATDSPTAKSLAANRSSFVNARLESSASASASGSASAGSASKPRTDAPRSASVSNTRLGRKSVTPDQPAAASNSRPEKRSASSTTPSSSERKSRQPTPQETTNAFRSRPPGLLLARQEPDIFNRLPPLKDANAHDCMELLQKKLSACADVIFDFRGSAADLYLQEKEAKKDTLSEILDFVNEPRRGSPELIVEDLVKMISANIFRPLPPTVTSVSNLIILDPEENEPSLESAWPHLQLVYEILLRFIMSTEVNPKTAKKYMDHNFVLKLLDLFASEDPRERDYLKTVMHRVYGKIMALRAFIRKAIQHVFFRYIHEQDGDAGVSELLEILGSIINGFAQPLKEEHKLFLKRCMIPLHKTRNLIAYHQQLTYCMTQYIEKDNKLVEPIINGLLRYWPVTNTPKEVLFLNEVEEILELTPSSEFQRIMEPLFKRMALCIRSPHFQVAERVLFLWNNTRIVKLVNQNKNILFPIIIGALYKNNKDHWNVTVHGLTFNVCKLLAEADPHLFDHCNEENIQREERREKEGAERRYKWDALRKSCQDEDEEGRR